MLHTATATALRRVRPERAVNAAGRCKPCAATEAAEARRIADVVMSALDQRFPRRDLRPVT